MTPRTYWLYWMLWTVATLIAVRLFIVRPVATRLDALVAAIAAR